MLPGLMGSLEEGLKHPNLYLVDENVALAMSFHEISLYLQNLFGCTARAFNLITHFDQNPTLAQDKYTKVITKDFSIKESIDDMSEADMY